MIQRFCVLTMLCLVQPAQSQQPPVQVCKSQAPRGAHPFAKDDLAPLAGNFEITLEPDPPPTDADGFRVHLYQPQPSVTDMAAGQAHASSSLAGWVVPKGSDSSDIAELRASNAPSIAWEKDSLHIHTYEVSKDHVLGHGYGYRLTISWYTKDAFGGQWIDDGPFLLQVERQKGYFCARRLAENQQ
jgi:hypothetical protein